MKKKRSFRPRCLPSPFSRRILRGFLPVFGVVIVSFCAVFSVVSLGKDKLTEMVIASPLHLTVLHADEPKFAESAPPNDLFSLSESASPSVPSEDATEVDEYTPPAGVVEITSEPTGECIDGVYLKNTSGKDVDLANLLSGEPVFSLSGNGPKVLIVHTHGTESYVPVEGERSTDITENVVCVGTRLAENLNNLGIITIHDTSMYDAASYNGSYARMYEGVKWWLGEYPSVKVVIDLHRDAVIADDGTKYSLITNIDGKRAAQLMLVMGTDVKVSHPDWMKNLGLAAKIQRAANSVYPNLFRSMMLTVGRYSQHAAPGSILIEFGASGNTLDQALYSADLLAPILASVLLEYGA